MCQCHSSCGSNSGCGCKSQGSSCDCNSSQCGSQKSCGCECGSCKDQHKNCDYSAKFLELADHAWMEVLKEKIKEHILANAKNMDELAATISEANHERWQKKMEGKQCCCRYEEKIKELLHQSCDSHSCKTQKPMNNNQQNQNQQNQNQQNQNQQKKNHQ